MRLLIVSLNFAETWSAPADAANRMVSQALTRRVYQPPGGEPFSYRWIDYRRQYLPRARTEGFRFAVAEAFTHVLLLDDDACPDPRTVTRLLDLVGEYPFICAPSCQRPLHQLEYSLSRQAFTRPLELPLLVRGFDPSDVEGDQYATLRLDQLNMGVQPISSTGFHCVVMATDLLTSSPNGAPTMQEEDAEGRPYCYMLNGGEDTLFCQRLREKGHALFCDTDHWVGHVSSRFVLMP